LKRVIASSIVLIVAVIAIFSAWYPVTTSQVVPEVVPEAVPYTTQFEAGGPFVFTMVTISGVPYYTGEQLTGGVGVTQTLTLTTYSTTPLTQYSQTTVSPYTILGGIASAVILVLLALVLVLSILLDRGIITVPTKHHRKRRKR
jgi:hypothetical protein